jgi:L-methionine (R)-S-oxide reductase
MAGAPQAPADGGIEATCLLPDMSLRATLAALEAHANADDARVVRAVRAAEVIRRAGHYRWVGLYDVTEDKIAVIAWSGPNAPRHPRFPRSLGLNGVAVASGQVVVVQDVSKDPRYLATLDDTRGEMIVPVSDGKGTVVGTIDVESAVADAFGEQDQMLLEQCSLVLRPLWADAGPPTLEG